MDYTSSSVSLHPFLHPSAQQHIWCCVYLLQPIDCSTDGTGFPVDSALKNLPAKQEMWVQSLSRENPLEKEMAAHFLLGKSHGIAKKSELT